MNKTTEQGTMDDRKYFVGPDWNKVLVVGTKRATKIAHERGCTAIPASIFRTRLCTHLNQAEIDLLDATLTAGR